MNQNKLSFQSENLVVDYISFKFQHFDEFTQEEITNYLFNLGFNSYQESGKLAKPIRESVLVNPKNRFEVCFVGDNSYWQGTLLHFSGYNALYFYSLVQKQLIDWTIFSSAVLSRFDFFFKPNYKTWIKLLPENFYRSAKKI
jgi:hypothetical protein